MDELRFRVVEGKGFQQYSVALNPKFRIPSRWTVARDSYEIYVEEKKKLIQFIKSSFVTVGLTTDCWTLIQKINV
ncbi:hypothetical protein PTKIN_Ptkin13bG0001100 [Pterospermum kingtungense]